MHGWTNCKYLWKDYNYQDPDTSSSTKPILNKKGPKVFFFTVVIISPFIRWCSTPFSFLGITSNNNQPKVRNKHINHKYKSVTTSKTDPIKWDVRVFTLWCWIDGSYLCICGVGYVELNLRGKLKSWKFPSIKVRHDNGFGASRPPVLWGSHKSPCTIILENHIKLHVKG